MKKLLLLFPLGILSIIPDACTMIDPTSYCGEKGLCQSTQDSLTCEQAYVRVSQGNLVRISTPPVEIRLSRAMSQVAHRFGSKRLSSKRIDLPKNIAMERDHLRLRKGFEILRSHLEEQFPYILYDQNVILKVMGAVRRFTPFMENYGPPKFPMDQYKMYWADDSLVWDIIAILTSAMNYMLSLDRDDPVREALFVNIIPYFHFMLSSHWSMDFIPPFTGPEYLDFLTTASVIHPRYLPPGSSGVWRISLSQNPNRLTIPVITIDDEERGHLPLSVLDILGLDVEYENNLQNAWDRVALSANKDLLDDPKNCGRWIENAHAAILFFKHEASNVPYGEKNYCEYHANNWFNAVDSVQKQCPEYIDAFVPILLTMFQLCDRSFFPLEDRVNTIFPLLVPLAKPGRRSCYVVHHDFNDVEQQMRFLNQTDHFSQSRIVNELWLTPESSASTPSHTEHIDILNRRMPIIWDAAHTLLSNAYQDRDAEKVVSNALRGVGVMIGLLLRERDPDGVLRNLVESAPEPSLTINSESIRRGLCRVVNCIGMDLVFANSELPEMLKLLR